MKKIVKIGLVVVGIVGAGALVYKVAKNALRKARRDGCIMCYSKHDECDCGCGCTCDDMCDCDCHDECDCDEFCDETCTCSCHEKAEEKMAVEEENVVAETL